MSVSLYLVESDIIPGKISEENKIRMMVLPIIAMLVITMVIAGWQHKEQVEIEKGYEEITITHLNETPPDSSEPIKGYNFDEGVNVTALTIVNNKSEFEFVVNPISITLNSVHQRIDIELLAEGEFDEYLDIESFKFSAVEKENNNSLYNYIDISGGSSRIKGGNIWPESQQKLGVKTLNSNDSAYIGYDLESNEFTAETEVTWTMPHDNIGEEFTLQLEAVVEGLSEDVTATVLLHIEGCNE